MIWCNLILKIFADVPFKQKGFESSNILPSGKTFILVMERKNIVKMICHVVQGGNPVEPWTGDYQKDYKSKCMSLEHFHFPNSTQIWRLEWSIIESFRLKKTFDIMHPTINLTLPSPPLSHVPKCHIYSLLNTSRDGDSTTSLGSLFQGLITLSVKNFFLISNLNLLWCNFRPFPLVLSLVTWEKRLIPTSLETFFR